MHNIFEKSGKLNERASYSKRKEQDFMFEFAKNIVIRDWRAMINKTLKRYGTCTERRIHP